MRASDLQKPTFALVMGGAGSGKNYMIAHNPTLSRFKLIDVDEMKKHVPLGDAIKAVTPALRAAFERGENVVHPTTGSHLKGQQNKILLAKEHGYQIHIYLIDTDPTVAAKRVAARADAGGHDVQPEAIAASNAKARSNFTSLKTLADKATIL